MPIAGPPVVDYRKLLGELESHPITQTLKARGLIGVGMEGIEGLMRGVGKVATGLPSLFWNTVQTVMPGDYRGVGATEVPIPITTDNPLEGLGRRGLKLADTVALGYGQKFEDRYNKYIAEKGIANPDNLSEQLTDYGAALGQWAIKDVWPGEKISEIVSGRRATGEPMSTPDIFETALGAAAEVLPIAAVAGRVGGIAKSAAIERKVADLAQQGKKLITSGDLRAQGLAADGTPLRPFGEAAVTGEEAAVGGATATEATFRVGNEAADIINQIQPVTRVGMRVPEFESLVNEVAATQVYRDLFQQSYTGLEGGMTHEVVMDAIQRGALSPERVGYWVNRLGLAPTDVVQGIVRATDATASVGGRLEEVLSQATALGEARMQYDAVVRGVPEAQAALNRLRRVRQMGIVDEDVLAAGNNAELVHNFWKKVSYNANEIERLRRGLLVSLPKTTVRNTISQTLNVMANGFDDLFTGIAEVITGNRSVRTVGAAFDDLMVDVIGVADAFHGSTYKLIDRMLDTVPQIRMKMYGDYGSADVARGFVDEAILSRLKDHPISGAAEGVVDVLNTANRFQEYRFREYFFRTQVEKNLRALGYSGDSTRILEKAIQQLDNPGASQGLREAVVDAFDHAMRQTFSETPRYGLGRAILDVYKNVSKVIPATAILPSTFPRFLINQWKWIFDHSPANMLDLMDPEFVGLMRGDAGAVASKEALRHLGRGLTGLTMLGTAYKLRTSNKAGPNYYELRSDKDPNVMIDYRAFQPFVQWLGVAHIIDKVSKGLPTNMSPNEMADFFIGARRISDSPMFAAVDVFRQLYGNNEDKIFSGIQKLVGNWMSGFVQPIEFYHKGMDSFNIWNTTPNARSVLAQKDLQNQELLGPFQQKFPNNALPTKISPYTGEPIIPPLSTTPDKATGRNISDLVLGIRSVPKTQIQQVIESLGYEAQELQPQFGNALQDNTYSKYMGMLLNINKDGQTLGDFLASTIANSDTKIEAKKLILKQALTPLREAAESLMLADVAGRPNGSALILEGRIRKSEVLGDYRQVVIDVIRRANPGLRGQ